MEKKSGFSSFISKIEQLTVVQVVRSGLVNMIPVLIIGAFALIIMYFPVEAYQTFIATFAGGLILNLFNFIYSATFGVLSVYMTFSISRSYMKIKADTHAVQGGAVVASLIAFFILAGAYLPDFDLNKTGPKSVFLAIITGLGASAMYLAFDKLFRRRRVHIFSAGADREFNRMLSSFLPILCVSGIFAVINQIVVATFSMDSFHSLLVSFFDSIFANMPDGFFKGFFFVFLSSLLWFFGIHGSDTLEEVMQTHFAPGLLANQQAIAAGGTATNVLTKEFFDCYVLIGGCGAAICLLIAILIISRNRAHRGLGYTAAFPMLFNINELMIFGLPVILNPIMFIPFMLVPLVCYTSAYIAISSGLVPMITNEVVWTTPIILGGLRATGSFAGALLQIFNVAVGVGIYLPFVRILDKRSQENMKRSYDDFVTYFRENESELAGVKLTDLRTVYGDCAKSLCADIKHKLKDKIVMAYQPQYDYTGKCVGVEALLRYDHPIYGVVYPPIVVKLAEEGGFLPTLEEEVLAAALNDREKLTERFGADITLSVNVTSPTVTKQNFLQFICKLQSEGKLNGIKLCLEVTEQAALSLSKEAIGVIKTLRGMGITFAIDDFSMGKTSINYLKNNLFDEIKLDGSLVKGLSGDNNCREIIQSITQLAASLKLTVIAEFVETEKERETLHEIGCNCYQGYLYSPAVYLDEQKQ